VTSDSPQARWRRLPNALTILRLMMAPLVAALLMTGDLAPAAVVFAWATASDFADGRLARSLGATSAFGRLADPIADKLLCACALVPLAIMDRAPWWAVGAILAREALVTALRLRALGSGTIVGSEATGKAKAALQGLAIMALILAPKSWPGSLALLDVAVAATLLSGLGAARGACRSPVDGAGPHSAI
jgi:CDP-diacylglycerol--glycerol-3-phosphate 3-phosphatidyltransferase